MLLTRLLPGIKICPKAAVITKYLNQAFINMQAAGLFILPPPCLAGQSHITAV
jgi:hypothetical protein